jgi:outer membrane protein TolC
MWLLAAAWAAGPGTLELAEVLAGIDARHPKIAATEAKLDAAEGGVLQSRGAFDPVLKGKAATYGGKYERNVVDVDLTSRTVVGPAVSVGYSRGTGDIPEYAGDTKTGPTGELVGRVEVPLLKGLGVNKERIKLRNARLKLLASEAALVDTQRMLRWDASDAYWSWVAAGMAVAVVTEQFELASRRASALVRQVEEGSRPQLDLYDNERVLAERTAKLAEARQKLETSALKLSLYLRAEDGTPVVPGPSLLPTAWPAPLPLPLPEVVEGVLDRRPDLDVAEQQVFIAAQTRRQAGNGLLPEVNVSATGIQPLDSDVTHEVIAGVEVKAPLALRAGRGARWQANAQLAAAEADRRMVADVIRAEVEMALVRRRLAEERAEATRLGAERAAEVLRLERRRFELGGSDLFKLLQREDALMKARDARVKAELAVRLADAEVTAVVGR